MRSSIHPASWSVALAFSLLALVGCTGVPASVDVNPEFRERMKGKTIGETSGSPALWGQTEETIAKKIFPSKTTKDEVRALFGSSLKVVLTDAGETWTYESSVVTIFSGSSYTRNTLVILFDDHGVVKRYSMNVDEKKA